MGSHKFMSVEEAREFAGLLASIDKRAKAAMDPMVRGERNPQDFMPIFRRTVKHYLEDKNDAPRVKATVRAKLQAWALEYGTDVRSNEPKTVRKMVNMTEQQWARIEKLTEGNNTKVAAFLLEAVEARLNELEGAA